MPRLQMTYFDIPLDLLDEAPPASHFAIVHAPPISSIFYSSHALFQVLQVRLERF